MRPGEERRVAWDAWRVHGDSPERETGSNEKSRMHMRVVHQAGDGRERKRVVCRKG